MILSPHTSVNISNGAFALYYLSLSSWSSFWCFFFFGSKKNEQQQKSGARPKEKEDKGPRSRQKQPL